MNKNSQKILCAFVLFVTMLTAVLAFSGVMTKDDAVTEAVVLKQGSTGNQVKTVQTKLKRWGYYTGAVDGIYGTATTKAVKYFQSKNGLTADGIVGKKPPPQWESVCLPATRRARQADTRHRTNTFLQNACTPKRAANLTSDKSRSRQSC